MPKQHSDDDRRGPQVLDLPRGVHLRCARHLPGHHQHLHVPPQVDHHHHHHLHQFLVVSPHINLSKHDLNLIKVQPHLMLIRS